MALDGPGHDRDPVIGRAENAWPGTLVRNRKREDRNHGTSEPGKR